MERATRRTVASHWADRLGCRAADFEAPEVTVSAADERATIQLFRRGDATVVGAPRTVADRLEERADGLADVPLADSGAWFRRLLAEADRSVEQFHGPTFFGYLDRASFTPVDAGARRLERDDHDAFESLRAAVPAAEWEQADPEFDPGTTAGLFRADALVAAAALGDPPLPHVSVVAHPDHRGEGYGRAVVSVVSEAAIDRGQVPQYRTADAWPWSVALAESLGYERWATGVLLALD